MTRITFLFAALLTLAALTGPAVAQARSVSHTTGAVYVLTNAVTGNQVVAYDRSDDGTLSPSGSYATGGTGTGAGLGSQGAVALGDDGRLVLAVNAGSASLSALQATGSGLKLRSVVPTNGPTPISVTVHGKLVYVLNAGAGGSITGYTIAGNDLRPIDGASHTLGAGAAGPAQIEFSPDGRTLAVTEKASNTIDTFAVNEDGSTGNAVTSRAVGATPFGFDFDPRGHLITSNASGSASSYAIGADGRATVISGAVAANQAAPCWLVVGRSGDYAYTANAGSGSISRYGVGADGSLVLLDAAAARFGAGSHPLDLAVNADGRFLYNLTDGLHHISGFQVAENGSLTPIQTIGDLPAGTAGIVAS